MLTISNCKTKNWQRAFILHRRPWGESSLMLDLFTENHGRVCVIARGVVRSKRPYLKGELQPFTPLLVRWSGRGEVKTLRNAEAASIAFPLEGIILYCGFYINELISFVLQRETSFPKLFHDYLYCLQSLSESNNPEPALRRFEVALLDNMGYGIDFLHCARTGENIEDEMTYIYCEGKGFIASITISQHSFTGRDLRAMYEGKFPDGDSLRAAKRFTRMALKPWLYGKKLKSQELFYSLSLNKKDVHTPKNINE